MPEGGGSLDPLRVRERFHAGDLAGAIDDARALAREANAPDVAQALAAVAEGAWELGRAAAERALARDPRDALARWCRGGARVGLGDRAGALADWSWIVEDDPASRTAWKDRALLRALTGDRAGALEDLARVGRLSADDVVPRLWRVGLGAPAEELLPFAAGQGWSARLAQLLLGRASAAELLAEAHGLDPAEQRARRCQVHGYAGLLLERDRRDSAAAHYRACEATQVWHFVTHLWARERLRDGVP
ncbi:MAG: hypothetical protein KDD82_13575 [Planctomycetes bacterium]|nr:hypothetical protein [Planctomycetota bacterium]